MNAVVNRVDGIAIATLEGDIDFANVEALSRTVEQNHDDDVTAMIFDLTNVRYFDSAGIQMVFEFARRLALRREGFALVVPADSPLTRLLMVARVDEVAPLIPSISEAVAAVSREDPPPL